MNNKKALNTTIKYIFGSQVVLLNLLNLLMWIGQVSFGLGLGGIVPLAFYTMSGIVGFVILVVSKNTILNLLVAILMIVSNITFIHKASVGRGAEQRWNGNFFINYNRNIEQNGNETLESFNFDDEVSKDSLDENVDTLEVNKNISINAESLEDIDSLRKIWKWNEEVAEPEKSELKNFIYSRKNLFQDWGMRENGKFKFSFTIDERSFRPKGLDYKYTLNLDSLRVFTQEDFLDGVNRGVIMSLNKDSLVIRWSDNEASGVYYSR